jgi:hypothetical protein
MPIEPNIAQRIGVYENGQENIAWLMGKNNYDENGEIGRPLVLDVELTRDVDQMPRGRGYVGIAAIGTSF